MTTFLLVHGAWGGGWEWRFVADRLAAAGHVPYRVSLTGMGERDHLARPDVDLDTHVQDVLRVLHHEELTDVVLVGHSYGGAVVTGALKSERVARAVYLDAFVPKHGESVLEQHKGFGDLIKSAVGDGWQIPTFPGHTLTDHAATAALFDRHASASPFRMYESALTVDGERFARVPKGYVACTRQKFRYFMKLAEQKRALGWPVATVDGDHMSCLSDPLGTARAVLDAEPA